MRNYDSIKYVGDKGQRYLRIEGMGYFSRRKIKIFCVACWVWEKAEWVAEEGHYKSQLKDLVSCGL